MRPKTEYERALLMIQERGMQDAALKRYTPGPPSDAVLDDMKNCLKWIDITLDEIDKLSVIHVAGTKGKGSTCSYVESILRHHGYRTGFFSSPHLVDYRERICINGQMISKEVFTAAFWHVYEQLLVSKGPNDRMPSMFGLVFLVAVYIFVRVEKVDVAVIEVGLGGQFDQTNIIQRPVVCGITALHLDHQDVLGNTLGEIAWHKAGIFKKGVPAVTTPQSSQCAMEVLLNRANERECPLFVAPPLNESQLGEGLCLGIAGEKQLYNAALAVQLVRIWLQDKNGLGHSEKVGKVYHGRVADVAEIPELSTSKLSAEMIAGLIKTRLPGRAQIMKKGNVTYYLDGAHTTDSMEQCAKWFQDEAKKECSTIRGNVVRALVFCMTKPRLAAPHLQYLKDCGFRVAAFCPCVISTSAREHFIDHISLSYDRAEANQRAAEQMEDWETVVSALPAGQPNVCNGYVSADPPCLSASFPSTVSALWWASLGKNASLEALARADLGIDGGGVGTGGVEVPDVDAVHVQVLVTGSMLMVGRAIKLLDARE